MKYLLLTLITPLSITSCSTLNYMECKPNIKPEITVTKGKDGVAPSASITGLYINVKCKF